MMSDHIYLLISGDQMLHYPPHLMFYAPYATDKDIVSPPPTAGMPHLIRAGRPDAVIIVVPGKKQVISFAKLNLMLSSDCSQIGTGSSFTLLRQTVCTFCLHFGDRSVCPASGRPAQHEILKILLEPVDC